MLRFTIKKKITCFSVVLGICVGVVGSVCSYNLISGKMIHMSKQNAMELADIASSEIDGALHQTIKVGDEEAENYQEILQTITRIKEHSDLQYIYTMALNEEGNLVFIVDADQEDGALIGEEYEMPEDMKPTLYEGKLACDSEVTSDDWGSYYSAYAPIYNEKDIVGVVGCDVSTESVDEDLAELKKVMIITGALSALVCGLGGFLISKSISHNLRVLKKKINDISQKDGDLTQKIIVHSNDELSDIADEMNILISQIRKIIVSIKDTSNAINTGSMGLHSGTVEIAKRIANVSDIMETLSASMEEYSASAEVGSEEIDNTTERLEQVSDKINDYIGQSKEEFKRIEETAKMIAQKKESASETVSVKENNLQAAIEKAEEINQINSLAEAIVGISEQTNLLALNASIEAARAGEHGKGFAVVADEINKLSSSINETAVNIQELSNSLIITVKNLITDTTNMCRFVNDDIMGDYDMFSKSSKETKDNVKNNLTTMQYFSEQINEIKESMQQITSTISEIEKTAYSNADEITKVNMDMISVREISEKQDSLAKENHNCSEQLTEAVNRFQV